MSNRLQLYLSLYAQKPLSSTWEHLRKTLVEVYGHILSFLARAIRDEKWGDLTEFGVVCERLLQRATEEARLCESEIAEDWRLNLDARLEDLKEIHDLKASLTKL
jgi:hypothetical protein